METTPLFARSTQHLIPRIGPSKELSQAAFSLKKAGEIVDKAITVGNALFIVALAERKDADLKDFGKRKAELLEQFSLRKWGERVRQYQHRRCVEAHKKGEINISSAAMVTPGYLDSQKRAGKQPTLPAYTPCKTLAQQPFGLF